MKLNIEDFKSVIVEQHDGSTYLIEIKDDVLSFKPIDIVNNSELKECKKIKKYFEALLNNNNENTISEDEQKAYKKWIEDTFKCSKRKEKIFSKNEMIYYNNIPHITNLLLNEEKESMDDKLYYNGNIIKSKEKENLNNEQE